MTRGRCEEMSGEPAAATGRVVLVKKIVMKDGAVVGGRPAILPILYYSYFITLVNINMDNCLSGTELDHFTFKSMLNESCRLCINSVLIYCSPKC